MPRKCNIFPWRPNGNKHNMINLAKKSQKFICSNILKYICEFYLHYLTRKLLYDSNSFLLHNCRILLSKKMVFWCDQSSQRYNFYVQKYIYTPPKNWIFWTKDIISWCHIYIALFRIKIIVHRIFRLQRTTLTLKKCAPLVVT